MSSLWWSFHGVLVELRTEIAAVAAFAAADFSWFRLPDGAPRPPADVVLTVHREAPPASPVRGLPVGRRAWVGQHGGWRWIHYRGGGLLRSDLSSGHGELWSQNEPLLIEATYLFVMSRVGEALDRRSIHRMHAAAVARGGRAAMMFLPSGGGKSTLVLEAMRRLDVQLLSDDLPLISGGTVLPFPGRLGFVRPPAGFASDEVRIFDRMEHGRKWLVDIGAFAERVAGPCAPVAVAVGLRDDRDGVEFRPIGPQRAWAALFAPVVVGVGLPQAVEHVLRADLVDVVEKASISASRARAAWRLVRTCSCWSVRLGRDEGANVAAWCGWVDRVL